MDSQWDDSLPIYRQLRDRVVAMILEGVLKEGDPLPSRATSSSSTSSWWRSGAAWGCS
jgi:DNA-binding transcriptional regulator YhcF (GntR family)